MKKSIYKVNNKMKPFGRTDLDEKIIEINKKKAKKKGGKGELIDTIVHEKTHLKHPKAHEKTVIKKTKKIIKKMGTKAKSKLYKKVK